MDASLRARRLDEARAISLQLQAAWPQEPRSWITGAQVHLARREADEALNCLRRLTGLRADDPGSLIYVGSMLAAMGRRSDAHAMAQRIARLPLKLPQHFDSLGSLFTHCEDPARGYDSARQAVALAPSNLDFRYNLAMVERMVGELESAEQNLNRVLSERPWEGSAQLTRSGLRKQSAARNHIEPLLGLLGRAKDRAGEIALRYALAKELDDVGRYGEAFRFLSEGASLQRQSMAYDVAGDVRTLEALVQRHRSGSLAVEAGYQSDEPIFIVGLPRTGTTLLERILGGHREVQSCGELPDFQRLVIEGVQRVRPGPMDKLEFVGRSMEVPPAPLGRSYIEATRPLRGQKTRFTDKLPINYLYAGLIHRALPGAKLIGLRRHPMDACFAMYRTLFTGAYPFSYDLLDLGRYYLAWRALMDHWQSALGTAWLSVDYESLVSAPEPTARAIFEHCGLDWDPQCLAVESRSAPVTTESAVQVRRPISTASVGTWRRYAQELKPLADYFRQHGIPVD